MTVGELRYRRTGKIQHPRPQQNAWYNRPDKTLYDILTRQEYWSHTITAKTYKASYENVHEFIDRILVHELDRETNTRKIEIFYSFVGRVRQW